MDLDSYAKSFILSRIQATVPCAVLEILKKALKVDLAANSAEIRVSGRERDLLLMEMPQIQAAVGAFAAIEVLSVRLANCNGRPLTYPLNQVLNGCSTPFLVVGLD